MEQTLEFKTLDVCWSLRTEEEEFARALAALYAGLRSAPGSCGDDALCFVLSRGPDGWVLGLPGGGLRPLLPAPLTHAHAHMEILNRVHDALHNHLLLHASCVAFSGVGLAICGPSGFGKTTLATALCQRGAELLSDEFCALERATGRIWPYPRLPGYRTPQGPGWWSFRGFSDDLKWYPPDPAVAAKGRRTPVPLGTVVVLANRPPARYAAARQGMFVGVTAGEGQSRFERTLRGMGVSEPESPLVLPGMVCYRFSREDHGRVMKTIDKEHDAVIYFEDALAPPAPRDFKQPPRLSPLTGALRMLSVLPYVRNRAPASQTMLGCGGSAGRLWMHLAAACEKVPVYWMQAGSLDESVKLLKELILDVQNPIANQEVSHARSAGSTRDPKHHQQDDPRAIPGQAGSRRV